MASNQTSAGRNRTLGAIAAQNPEVQWGGTTSQQARQQQADLYKRLGVPTNGAPPDAPAPPGAFSPQAIDYYHKLDAQNAQYGNAQMAGYQNAFQSALNNARGNINQSLSTALGDIAQSQQHAQAALGQLPGQFDQAYNQTMGTRNNALAAMTKAQAASGMKPLMDASAFMAPETAAIQGTHQAELSNVPLLQQGIEQQVASRRAQAQLAAQDRLNQLDLQNAGFQQQLAGQQMGYAHDAQMAQLAQQNNNANALRDFGYTEKLNNEKTATAAADQNPGYSTFGGSTVKNADVVKAQTTPQYARAVDWLKQNEGDPEKHAQVWKQMQQLYQGNPALLAAIQAAITPGK